MSARLPRAPQTFDQLVLAFLTDHEQERGLARNTVNATRSDLVQFGAFLADRTSSATRSRTLKGGAGEHALAVGGVEEVTVRLVAAKWANPRGVRLPQGEKRPHLVKRA